MGFYSMSESGKGDKTAIALAVGQLGDDDDEALQLSIFDEPQTIAGKAMRPQQRGRGRPAGSKNLRTQKTVNWLLARHRDPRQVLLEIAEANPVDLAALLQCTFHEAMQEIRLAAIGVLPYIAQKMPLAVDVRHLRAVHLTIVEGGQNKPIDDGGIDLTARIVKIIESEENQQVIEHEPTKDGQQHD
jgi:hypothetical protein